MCQSAQNCLNDKWEGGGTDGSDMRTPNDNSVSNGSSIAFIVEFAGKRVLLGADAHSEVLVSSGQRMNAESRRIDAFKLPHHGSAKNVTTALLETFPADRFVVSTNGAHHESALQNACNPHEHWLCGAIADGENSQEAFQ